MNRQILLIGLYLSAITAANLIITRFGSIAVLPVGFVLIGLDITTRDYLHEVWKRNRWLKLGILIAIGSIISWLINQGSSQVALASFVAFSSSGIIDTITYHTLRRKQYLIKVNGSNMFSSLTDSMIFLTVAFGSFMPVLILSQFAVKVLGGFIWSLILRRFNGILYRTSHTDTSKAF